jgi:hypothetical protein
MAEEGEQSLPCKEPGCDGRVTYRRTVVPVYRGMRGDPDAPAEGRIIRVYLKCVPNKHEHEYAVRV